MQTEEFRVLFLDVDGVLNCQNTGYRVKLLRLFKHASKQGFLSTCNLDRRKIYILKRIVKACKVKVVISSAGWDPFPSNGKVPNNKWDRKLRDILLGWNVDVIGRVQVLSQEDCNGVCVREAEIRLWLSQHPEVTNIVILDDELTHSSILEYTVSTNRRKTFIGSGLRWTDIRKAKYIIKRQFN